MIRRNIASPLHLNDCAMWFDAAQGVTYNANGVSQWNDSSGKGRHVAQGVDANKPTYNPSNAAFGGSPTVDWDTAGNGDRLDRVAPDNIALPLTVIACASVANLAATPISLFNNTAGTALGFERVNGTLWSFTAATPSQFPTPPQVAPDKPFTLSLVFSDPSDCRVLIDGNAVLTRATPGPTTMSILRLGNSTNRSSGQNWNGSISEFIVYSRRLSDGEVAMAEAYLRRRFVL